MSEFEGANMLDRTEMSHNLRGSLQRAITYAFEQSHRQVTLEHLLLALADDREAAVILESSAVNVPALMTDVSGYLGRLEDRVDGGQQRQPELGGDVQHIIQSAGAAAQKSKRRAVSSALVLAAIVGDGRSPSAQILRNHGLTFENAIAALKQANSKPAASPAPLQAPPPQSNPAQPSDQSPVQSPRPSPAQPTTPVDDASNPAAGGPMPGSALAASTAAATNAGAARIQNMQAAHEIIASARERIAAARGTIATRTAEPDLATTPSSRKPDTQPPPVQQPSNNAAPAAPPAYRDQPKSAEAVTQPPPAPPKMPQAVPPGAAPPAATASPKVANEAVTGGGPPKMPTPPPIRPQPAPSDWAAPYQSVTDAPRSPAATPEQPPAPARPAEPPPAQRDAGNPPKSPTPPRPPTSAESQPAQPGKPTLSPPPTLAPPPSFDPLPRPARVTPLPPTPQREAGAQQPMSPVSAAVAEPTANRPSDSLSSLTRAQPAAPPPPIVTPPAVASPPPPGPASRPTRAPVQPTNPPPARPDPPQMPTRQLEGDPPPQQRPVYSQPPARSAADQANGPTAPPHYVQPAPPPTAYAPPQPTPAEMHPGQPAPDVSPIEPELLVGDIPTRMSVGVAQTVEIRAPRARLEAWSGGNADPRARDEQIITKAMTMRLRAPEGGFTIETASPETQWSEGYMGPLSDDIVSWRWIVTPLERGRLPVQLSVATRIVGRDGLAAARALPEQLVSVRVAPNYGRLASRFAIGAALVVTGLVLGYFADGLFGIGSSLLAQR
ncbi:MAG: Clp protease N-terminal domain-containing protein [Hyphomicrobiaceae bacterium]